MIIRPAVDDGKNTVVIVGVQRGGTSMVAGVVRELGINLGQNLGNNHEDPEFLPRDLRTLKAVMRRRDAEHDVWGWKMPHTSEYLLKLIPAIRGPKIIVVFRNLLAMTESQLKRSETSFDNAFKFSMDRLKQVASIVPKIEAPLMLVNYEKAIAEPQRFVDEMIEFLQVSPDAKSVKNAVEMIDPSVGYKRASHEAWKYTVSKVENSSDQSAGEMRSVTRRDHKLVVENDGLVKSSDGAFIEFSNINAESCTVYTTRTLDPDTIRVSVDIGKGFSHNMAEKISLYKGRNKIEISAKNLKKIRVHPSFNGVKSNIFLLEAFSI